MKQGADSPVDLNSLQFFVTGSHPCSYLPDREAITLFADPSAQMSNLLYSQLSAVGFRRSGAHLYRPHCPICRACIPVRIPVNDFVPNRSQRRTWNKNLDVEMASRPVEFTQEHFDLYRKYIRSRHPGGGMDQDEPEHYLSFIASPWSQTALYEFRIGPRLFAVAVTDHLQDGLSAVYTYFDPEDAARAPGVFALMSQVEQARQLGLDWLYLGYWIEESPKMAYKSRYQPLEYFNGRNWTDRKGILATRP